MRGDSGRERSANGARTEYVYDASGNLVRVTGAQGNGPVEPSGVAEVRYSRLGLTAVKLQRGGVRAQEAYDAPERSGGKPDLFGQIAQAAETAVGSLLQPVKSLAKWSPAEVTYALAKICYKHLEAGQQRVLEETERTLKGLQEAGLLTPSLRKEIVSVSCSMLYEELGKDYSRYEDMVYPFDPNRTLEEYMADSWGGEYNISAHTIIEGVMIEPGEYVAEELRRLIDEAKARGTKIDWKYFYERYMGEGEDIISWCKAHKGEIIRTIAIVGGTAVIVTLTITSAGAAAYVVGQAAIYYELSQSAAQTIMLTVAYGGALTYTAVQASDLIEVWTDENPIRDRLLKGDGQSYETVKNIALICNLITPAIGSWAKPLGYGGQTEQITKTLKHKATSGVELVSTPGKTTTILGRYKSDTQEIIQELGIPKNTDFSGNPGGFKLLNTPDELYTQLGAEKYWEQYNQPFLDAAIERGDVILMATPIADENLYIYTNGMLEMTGYGREYFYLIENGYEYVEGIMMKMGGE